MSGSTGTLGKYQIIREIARSNDIVYEAYDPVMNRRVALKEMSISSGMADVQREDRRNRFLREARAAGTLTHPNIVTVYEYGEDSNRHFIAMEFLDGHTLRNEIDTQGFLSLAEVCRIAIEVLEGLDYAHKHGVIHRDIKPENIQLLPDDRIKLTDFGIARLTFEPNLTMDGQVFGTPSYMSPEQVVGKEIDIRSDLFSVGVVMYEMICGKKPFAGDSVVSITYAIMNNHPDQPNQANWAIWQVIEQALDKSAQLRFASASAMIEAIRIAEKASTGTVIDPRASQSPVYPDPYQPPTTNYAQNQVPSGPPPVLTPYGTPIYGTGGVIGGADPYGTQGQIIQPGQSSPQGSTYSPSGIQQGSYPQAYGQHQTPTYAYNPYQQVPPGQQPQGQPPGYAVGPPVYYPAPPRRPLISPETSIFMRKLLVAVILIGTFFGLIIVIIQATTQQYERMRQQSADQVLSEDLGKVDLIKPLDQRIEKVREISDRFQNPQNKSEAGQKLAELYVEQADKYLKQGRYAEAEDALTNAVQEDGSNVAVHVKRAQIYAAMARQASEFVDRQAYWSQAGASWSRAGELERDPVNRRKILDNAVSVYESLGNELLLDGQHYGAREAFKAALGFADRASSKYGELERKINRITD